MTSKLLSASALLATTLVVHGCDSDTDLSAPGQSLRANFKVYAAKKISGSFSSGGHGDYLPKLPFPFPDVFIEEFAEHMNAAHATLWKSTEDAELTCSSACDEAGGDWDGEVFAEGDYAIGEMQVTENEAGELFSSFDVEFEIEFGCTCEG